MEGLFFSESLVYVQGSDMRGVRDALPGGIRKTVFIVETVFYNRKTVFIIERLFLITEDCFSGR